MYGVLVVVYVIVVVARVVVIDTAAVVATATATTMAIEVNLHTVSEAIIIAATTISVRWGVGHNMLFWCFLILPFYDNFIAPSPSSREWLHLTH